MQRAARTPSCLILLLLLILSACATADETEGRASAEGYGLRLVRISLGTEVAIPLEEWMAALEALEGVRPVEDVPFFTNPSTGEVIRIPRALGDAEIYLSESGTWVKAIAFARGRAIMGHPAGWSTGQETAWRVVAQLCDRLGLVAVGDEGERYDPDTREVVRDLSI